jgi:hypothetical protein
MGPGLVSWTLERDAGLLGRILRLNVKGRIGANTAGSNCCFALHWRLNSIAYGVTSVSGVVVLLGMVACLVFESNLTSYFFASLEDPI